MNIQELTKEVRSRIAKVCHWEVKHALMLSYLGAARASEVVGIASGSDTTTPYGPRGTDASEQLYYLPMGAPPVRAAIFTLRTAKRNGRERYLALPLDPKYEPWAQPLLDYFRAKGDSLAFPFTRQTLHSYASDAFAGLTYTIAAQPKEGRRIREHERQAAVHFLRHIRATELASIYGFDPMQLATYCGWVYKSAGLSRTMCLYIEGTWQSYFARLLIERA